MKPQPTDITRECLQAIHDAAEGMLQRESAQIGTQEDHIESVVATGLHSQKKMPQATITIWHEVSQTPREVQRVGICDALRTVGAFVGEMATELLMEQCHPKTNDKPHPKETSAMR